MDEKGLGLRLQQARRDAGLTQQELCHKSGLSYSTLAKIERGAIRSPSIFTIQLIASTVGVSIDELIGHEGTRGIKAAKKQSKSGVSFVYFDVNGCLVRFFHRAFGVVAKETGVSSDIVETTFWHYNDAVCRGEMSMDEFNVTLAKRFGVDSINWIEYYLAAVDPVLEMRELLDWASQHYRIGLLSNIMPGFIAQMRERLILPEVDYDVIIDSSEVGVLKPEAKIYEIAAEKAGCKPEDILLIDDSRANLIAAEKAGWHVLWFDDYHPEESIVRVKSALEF
jgi:FMN phosphatase YigB (HAD superfamily)/DNA-binding XRE family transcriptional regulator